MANPKFKISDAVREVLASASFDGNSVKLNSGQLERKLYLEVNKVLEGAGGKWNRKAGVHVFASDPRVLLGIAVETGVATNLKQLYQSFYTPAGVADQMVELVKLVPGCSLLEPSAGDGALLDAARRSGWNGAFVCYEINPLAVDALAKKGYLPTIKDFLTVRPDPDGYQAILMNPPFTGDAAVKHISHALKFLADGKRLVSVIPRGMMEKESKPVLKLIEQIAGLSTAATYRVYDLPDATFKEAGTLVRTSLLVVQR